VGRGVVVVAVAVVTARSVGHGLVNVHVALAGVVVVWVDRAVASIRVVSGTAVSYV